MVFSMFLQVTASALQTILTALLHPESTGQSSKTKILIYVQVFGISKEN